VKLLDEESSLGFVYVIVSSSCTCYQLIVCVFGVLIFRARVVGWPPVRSLRQKALVESKMKSKSTYVKVGADGAPYLRKLDLDMYKSYQELLRALDQMFPSFITSGEHNIA